MVETNTRAAALELAEKFGLYVLLLEEKSKKPASRGGSKDATTDTEELEWGFEQAGGANLNIGIATGSKKGNLIVIDCDVKDDCNGWDYLLDWQVENGVKLPETATVETGSGGTHLFYWNTSDRVIHNSANKNCAVDVRGEGGYVVAPPSVHPLTGKPYFWDLPPDEVPIADADDAVFNFIGDLQSKEDTYDDCFVLPDKIGEGERNDTLMRYASSMRSKSVEPTKIWDNLRKANKERCKPPMGEVEVRSIYNSILKFPEGNSEEVKASKAKAKKSQQQSGRSKFPHHIIGQALIDEHGACKIEGAPAIRNAGCFYDTGWDAIDNKVYEYKVDATTANLREVRHWLSVKAPEREVSPWNLIAFKNGVFDLLKHEFREYADDDVFINVIPHSYNADAESAGDLFNQFIVDVSNNDIAVGANLLETIGLSMLHVSRYEYAPVLLGRGSNGKSVFMKFLRYLLGAENVSTLKPKEVDKRFQAVQLVGKLANLSDDIANGYLDGDACSQIKNLATGDPIHTDVKGSEGFTFTPCCTLVFSANEFPRLADTSEGMMRRLFPIEFSRQFIGREKDPNLLDKLKNEECAERAIHDALLMLQVLVERGEMTPNEMSVRIKRDIVTDNSTVLQWIDDIGGWGAVQGLSKRGAYDNYADWAKNNGVRNPVSAKTMNKEIEVYSGMSLCAFSRDEYGKRVRVFDKAN